MNRKNIILAILLIGFSICLYFFSVQNKALVEQQQEVENFEYPLIEKTNKDYQGYILKYSYSKIFRGRVLNIELVAGDKFAISGIKENPAYKRKNLADNLAQGDSIFYNHMTYEFYIYKKNGEELYFKLFNSY